MKTVLDYIHILEDAAATNVVGSGAIATTEPPIGAVKKRKKTVEVESVEAVGTDPLANIYAADNPPVTTDDSSDEDKRKFALKQNYQLDQVSSL